MLIIEEAIAKAAREHKLRLRKGAPRGIVIHTTGSGPWTRWTKHPETFASPFDAARYTYERISDFSGHYLVDGDDGRVCKLVDPSMVAWHVGSRGSWRYKLPGWAKDKGFGWFTTRFPGCNSPRDLLGGALWREGSANELTIGIEVAPPKEGPRAAWSPQAWRSLRLMVKKLGLDYGIPLDRFHVITHSDAHPLSRTTKAGAPWDPSPRQWLVAEASRNLGLLTPYGGKAVPESRK